MNLILTTRYQAQYSQYDILGRELLEKERQDGNLGKRSKQAIIHSTFTEMRITQLEEKLRKLQAEFQDKPDDFKFNANRSRSQWGVYKSVLKSSLLGDFTLTARSLKIPFRERPSMEALVTDQGPALRLQDGPVGDDNTNTSVDDFGVPYQRTPERLRIRYAPLIRLLERTCRETLSNSQIQIEECTEDDQMGGAPTVFLRPWKLFVAYEKEIRDSVFEIEEALGEFVRKQANDKKIERPHFDDSKWYSTHQCLLRLT